MHPKIEIDIDGKPVAGSLLEERLIKLTVTDKEGVSSDAFSAELNDGPPDFLELKTGSIVDIRMGYVETGVRSVGKFLLDQINGKFLPYSLTISGKSADLRRGALKENKERHWDKKTLKAIVEEIASNAGLTAVVDGKVGSHVYDWLGQMDESDIHFLERIARRHNALFTIKNGKMMFAERGSAMSAAGRFVGTVIVTPDIIIKGSGSFEANDRTKYQKVVAYYQDKDQAKRVEIEASAGGDSDSVFRLPEPFADVAEADKAARSKAKQLKRGEGATSVNIEGDTAVISGAAMYYEGVRPGLDGVPYIIDTAVQDYSKGPAFITQISAKLYDGQSGGGAAGGGAGGAGQGGSGTSPSSGSGGRAPNSPSGTPATPSGWAGGRRNGQTDAN